ncbi:integrator complex subunit 3 homolog [Drosophila sulfurigaster albostrigata]|uniref:Integrator complex subunit 3 homolog n=1 Tax=Drosophila albomicans TaxID=7291 RepID=A0A6P8XA06_DROAB|nr:integrator complex subunit 3 homolog [Drosophila albomicans]XP_060658216.1 integrator complex subunit 3 homolog [Drosophila nasuta]XP_062134177.1 integrator complex subunit 3 homolog [Drosophila sulfurigaster albostrigata]
MFFKLMFASCLVLVLAKPQHPPAAQYPAGVNPQDCPGFPICDNARLHNPHSQWQQPQPQWQQPQPQWQPQPQQHWQQPQQQWQQPQQQWQPQPSWNAQPAPAAGGGDKYPAGINPQTCPNYPYCDVNAGHAGAPVAAPPLPGWTERLYPAGVSPHQCPNFPYCN